MDIQKTSRPNKFDGIGLAKAYKAQQERLNELESKVTSEDKKPFNLPKSWTSKFKNQHRKESNDVLVLYHNKKNEIEPPQYMRVIGGNVIIHNNKSHLYDPKYMWKLKMKGMPTIYQIREIDGMPITNDDYEELKKEGRSTDWNEILLKQLLEAKTSQAKKIPVNWVAIAIVSIIAIGGLIWYLSA